MRKTESQKIALCGVLGALSVVLLLLGSALQIGTYAAPMLVSFLQIPVLEEYGGKYALLLYITVSILAVLLVPETELALFYALVMGYYPVLRKAMQRVKSTLLRWITKFAVFNAGTVLMYLVLFALLAVILWRLRRQCGLRAMVWFAVSQLAVTVFWVPHQVQYFTTFCIAYAGCAWVLARPRRAGQLSIALVVLGTCTAFCDLLVTPIITLGLPVAVWLC